MPNDVTFRDVCLNRDGTRGAEAWTGCIAESVLAIFGYEPGRWATREQILTTLNDASRASWNSTFVARGFTLGGYLGGATYSDAGEITGAKVLQATWTLAQNATYDDTQDDEADPLATGWEDSFLDYLEVRSPSLSFFCLSGRDLACCRARIRLPDARGIVRLVLMI